MLHFQSITKDVANARGNCLPSLESIPRLVSSPLKISRGELYGHEYGFDAGYSRIHLSAPFRFGGRFEWKTEDLFSIKPRLCHRFFRGDRRLLHVVFGATFIPRRFPSNFLMSHVYARLRLRTGAAVLRRFNPLASYSYLARASHKCQESLKTRVRERAFVRGAGSSQRPRESVSGD